MSWANLVSWVCRGQRPRTNLIKLLSISISYWVHDSPTLLTELLSLCCYLVFRKSLGESAFQGSPSSNDDSTRKDLVFLQRLQGCLGAKCKVAFLRRRNTLLQTVAPLSGFESESDCRIVVKHCSHFRLFCVLAQTVTSHATIGATVLCVNVVNLNALNCDWYVSSKRLFSLDSTTHFMTKSGNSYRFQYIALWPCRNKSQLHLDLHNASRKAHSTGTTIRSILGLSEQIKRNTTLRFK